GGERSLHRSLERHGHVRPLQRAGPDRRQAPRRRVRSADVPALRGGDRPMSAAKTTTDGKAKTKARLRTRYAEELMPALQKEIGCSNPFEVPRLEKIVLNIGLGEAIQNVKLLDSAVEEMA